MNRKGLKSAQRGLALVTVLWVVVLLTVMAGSFSLSMRREGTLVRNIAETTQARYLAEAGIRYGILEIFNTDPVDRWHADGTAYPVEIGGTRIDVALQEESGKVDINAAPEELLDGVFRSVGLEDELRRQLVDGIVDWRDPDDLHRLNGAEKDEYEAAGLTYVPRNGPFLSIDELRLVLGMTSEVYRAVQPMVTVFSGQPGVNPLAAPREVLLALPGVDEAQVDSYLAQREASTGFGRGVAPPPFSAQALTYLSGRGGVTYSIVAQARLQSGISAGLKAVVTRSSRVPGRAFSVVDWEYIDALPDLFADKEEAA
jgi:general secretion pathway protein K